MKPDDDYYTLNNRITNIYMHAEAGGGGGELKPPHFFPPCYVKRHYERTHKGLFDLCLSIGH